MKSLRELFKIGCGPSSSHTMGPHKAATLFKNELKDTPAKIEVTLYGSLAATGKGHMTDLAIKDALQPIPLTFTWKPDQVLPEHPNGIRFQAISETGDLIQAANYYSIGGGTVKKEGQPVDCPDTYEEKNLQEVITRARQDGLMIWQYVDLIEGEGIWDYLKHVLDTMYEAIQRGLDTEGILAGGLGVERKSHSFYLKTRRQNTVFQRTGLLSAYALAVAEENASRGIIVTAPTCGSCGILPATLMYLRDFLSLSDQDVLHGLATAGVVGNVIKQNASISGAEAGCQAEVGSACAMAAAAAAEIMGGSLEQIEYAAEMGLEHHLGLTCDPVAGLVQIPCIERNAAAATRAVDCADYALLSDGRHRITFDEVVETMRQTGLDMNTSYRETAKGGLAKVARLLN